MAKHKGLFKRGNIWWMAYVLPDGRTRRESAKTTLYRDAEALLTQKKMAVQEGKDPTAQKVKNYTFRELARDYEKWSEKQKSFRSKKGFIKQLSQYFGNVPLKAFSVKLIEDWQGERLNINYRGKTETTAKPATVNRLHQTLRHMFTKAVEWEMASEETLKRVRKVKLLAENNKRLRFLSQEECRELIDTCGKYRRLNHLAPIIITAIFRISIFTT